MQLYPIQPKAFNTSTPIFTISLSLLSTTNFLITSSPPSLFPNLPGGIHQISHNNNAPMLNLLTLIPTQPQHILDTSLPPQHSVTRGIPLRKHRQSASRCPSRRKIFHVCQSAQH